MHDVFISYEKESKNIADAICSALERNRIRCWYAPRDVQGPYAHSIVNAIEECKIFVLILNKNASESKHVLNEVEMAYEKVDDGLSIIPFKMGTGVSKEMEYYVKRIHWIDAMTSDLETSINDLLNRVSRILDVLPQQSIKAPREKNPYVDNADEREEARLSAQIRVVNFHAADVYDRVTGGKTELTVLDIGSNCGDQVMSSLGNRQEVKTVLGMDISKKVVDIANERYKQKSFFFCSDCESETFEQELKKVMTSKEISSFDIVNISHVLHHLKNPFKVLKVVRGVLSKEGTIIILDVDDGLHLAYPDSNGIFSKAVGILVDSKTSGCRLNGRETYSQLKKLGLDVKLDHFGINTVTLPYSVKNDLYKAFIELVPIVVEESKENNDSKAVSNLSWISNNMETLEGEYYGEDFMLNVGYIVYTATNK